MRASRTAGLAMALFTGALAALAGCNGHLDFGVARTDGGTGGSSGGMAAGTGGGGGRPNTGPGGVGACATDGDCRLSALHCDMGGAGGVGGGGQGRTCVECTADQHCTRAGTPRCDLALRRCVACLVAADCGAGQQCLGARCITTCTENGAPACPAGTECESGLCAACEADDNLLCAGGITPLYCLKSPPICAGCRSDADCAGTAPRCDPVRRSCVTCTSSSECPAGTPYCDPTTGTCVMGS